jgi:hypothetical protein
VSGASVWQSKRSSMIDPSCAQNPYIPLIVTWIQARPPIVFTKFTKSGSIGVCRQVGLAQCWKVFSPLDGTFRAKLSVMFKGRLLHSMVHSDEHVTDCNNITIQRGGKYDDNPFQTGYNNRHRPYRTRVRRWLLSPISMTGQHLGIGEEMGDSLRSYSRVTLDGL